MVFSVVILFSGLVAMVTAADSGGAPPIPMENCIDKLPNCYDYDQTSCGSEYVQWATDNCAARCGICKAPPTPAPACVDKLPKCADYSGDVCNSPDYETWATDNCRYFCRKCSPAALAIADSHTTTMPPAKCVDVVDCARYGANACAASFKSWSDVNCMNFCGLCKGVPTTPEPCHDKAPNCASYGKTTCNDPTYKTWAATNCKSFCGLCSGGAPPSNNGVPPLPVATGGR